MARYDLQIGGNFIPAERAVWPKRFRVGYRGPGPGQREVGMISLRLKDTDGLYRDGATRIETGQELLITRADEGVFRGLVSRLVKDRKHPWLDLEAKEQAAVLRDYKAGLSMLGIPGGAGAPNGMLYVWVRDEEITNPDTGEMTQVLSAIREADYEALSVEEQATYEKRWLFTAYYWMTTNAGTTLKLHWAEPRTIEAIIEDLRDQYLMQGQLPWTIGSIETDGPAWEEKLHVRDLDDEPLELNQASGLVEQEGHIFVYWYEANQIVNVAEVINRSQAIVLTRFRVVNPEWPVSVEGNPLLVRNDGNPRILAFYVRGGGGPPPAESWAMYVGYINLEDALGRDFNNMLTPHYYRRDGLPLDERWVYMTPAGTFHTTSTPTPQEQKTLIVTGGRYQLFWRPALPDPPGTGEGINLTYSGDVLLREIVYDFEDRSLAEILSDIAYVTGCDWWIDGNGRLQMQRAGQDAGTGTISGEILEEREIEELVQEEDFERSVSGIPISDTHAKLLKEAWAELKRSNNGAGKELVMKVPNAIGAQLGQNVQAAGRAHGKLEAMEFEGNKVTLETAL